MKYLILILCAVFFFFSCENIDKKEVPESVRKAFKKKYGKKAKEWEVENGNYAGEIEVKGKQVSGIFSQEAKWLETETEISIEEVPELIIERFRASQYSDFVIADAAISETSEESLLYELKVQRANKTFSLYFLPEGQLKYAREINQGF